MSGFPAGSVAIAAQQEILCHVLLACSTMKPSHDQPAAVALGDRWTVYLLRHARTQILTSGYDAAAKTHRLLSLPALEQRVGPMLAPRHSFVCVCVRVCVCVCCKRVCARLCLCVSVCLSPVTSLTFGH